MNILYIDASFRSGSRTKTLADRLVNKLGGNVMKVDLGNTTLAPLTNETLTKRDELLFGGKFNSDPTSEEAKKLLTADVIVVSAPFWDGSFPAILKTYIENVSVAGVTFAYSNGKPVKLIKATDFYFVTTSGGKLIPDYGYKYLEYVFCSQFGVNNSHLIYAENLDFSPEKADEILSEAIKKYGL